MPKFHIGFAMTKCPRFQHGSRLDHKFSFKVKATPKYGEGAGIQKGNSGQNRAIETTLSG